MAPHILLQVCRSAIALCTVLLFQLRSSLDIWLKETLSFRAIAGIFIYNCSTEILLDLFMFQKGRRVQGFWYDQGFLEVRPGALTIYIRWVQDDVSFSWYFLSFWPFHHIMLNLMSKIQCSQNRIDHFLDLDEVDFKSEERAVASLYTDHHPLRKGTDEWWSFRLKAIKIGLHHFLGPRTLKG